jgi:hypothetical protein
MVMHRSHFVSNWVVAIKNRMASMCKDGFVLSVIILFYNDVATDHILESKRNMRLELAAIEKRAQLLGHIPWYAVGKRLIGYLKVWRDRIAVRVGVWLYEPSEGSLNQCTSSAEFEFMKYLHQLTERMAAWRSFSCKHLPLDQLPPEYVEIKGFLDAPHAEYEYLCRIQEMADAFIPADMQRTMFVMMLSEKMGLVRPLQPVHKE